MVFKIVVSDPKSRKAYQKEAEENASGLIGKKVGEKVSGSFLGLEGYELEITGGSDRQGFPIRPDVDGQGRKRIVLAFPPGFHPVRHGERKRKSVRGNTISKDISQINLKIVKAGKKPLETVFGVKEKPKEGKAKEGEKPAEEKAKPEGKKEAPAGGKGEKPAEAKKEEAKPEEKPAEEKMGVKTLEEIESPVKETRDRASSTQRGHETSLHLNRTGRDADISSSKAKEEMKKEKEVAEKETKEEKPAEKGKKPEDKEKKN